MYTDIHVVYTDIHVVCTDIHVVYADIHDASVFPYPPQHLTQQLAQYWKKWVEFPPDALASLAKGGYYNIKLEQGFRLVAFNSDYGSVATM